MDPAQECAHFSARDAKAGLKLPIFDMNTIAKFVQGVVEYLQLFIAKMHRERTHAASNSRPLVMPDLIRHPAFFPREGKEEAGPRIKSGVTGVGARFTQPLPDARAAAPSSA